MLDGIEIKNSIADEALAGLRQTQKTLPAKLFYDEEGCRLFGEITRLPEYYPTRTETALLRTIGPDLPRTSFAALVEYGASDETKSELILPHLNVDTYVPIDVAPSALDAIVGRMSVRHAGLRVLPLACDFLAPFDLPSGVPHGPNFGFFPGSTIGNLDRPVASAFLSSVAATLGPQAVFLVGVDLRKDRSILIPAYDDAQGVTAAFNLNILTHLNQSTDANFDPAHFVHRARWNDEMSRIEMHLECQIDHIVTLGGERVGFRGGETIHTENSYKYTVVDFQRLASKAGWTPIRVWTDDRQLFSVHLLMR
ncbi:MAG: L-histidine N(alpha)-methyltransferase [Janthinobacterium lividum]